MSGINAVSSGMPQAMAGASRHMTMAQKMSDLFDKIDTGQTGSISKNEFESAFQSMKMPGRFKALGADAIFAKLDPNGTGSVSKEDFIAGMKSMFSHPKKDHTAQVDPGSTLASGMAALNDAIGGTASDQAPQPSGSGFSFYA